MDSPAPWEVLNRSLTIVSPVEPDGRVNQALEPPKPSISCFSSPQSTVLEARTLGPASFEAPESAAPPASVALPASIAPLASLAPPASSPDTYSRHPLAVTESAAAIPRISHDFIEVPLAECRQGRPSTMRYFGDRQASPSPAA